MRIVNENEIDRSKSRGVPKVLRQNAEGAALLIPGWAEHRAGRAQDGTTIFIQSLTGRHAEMALNDVTVLGPG